VISRRRFTGDNLQSGTKRRTYLEQNAAAVNVDLTADDLRRIDAELPETAGERYDQAGMTSVDI
jgi:hypothetical protein